MGRRISVRAVIVHEAKLLCVRLKNYKGSIPGDFWCLPGGTLEEGESLTGGLIREMVEETGIVPKVGNLLYVNHFKQDRQEHIEFMFHVTNTDDYLNLDLQDALYAEEEIAEIALVEPKTTRILPEYLTTEPIAEQINNSVPTKIFTYF